MPETTTLHIQSLSPNPFNPTTSIAFATQLAGPVSLEVYDVAGRMVSIVELGVLTAGQHRTQWDGRNSTGANVASGAYFLRLSGEAGTSQVVKALLIR